MPVTLSCDAIDARIHVGSYPADPDDIAHLRGSLGVSAVLNLQSDEDFSMRAINWQAFWAVYTAQGIVVERVPIRDFVKEDLLRNLERAVAVLHTFLSDGHVVYLHCNAGVNRSPTVAIAYLALHEGMSVEDAAAQVQARRRCLPYLDVIERWLGQRTGSSP